MGSTPRQVDRLFTSIYSLIIHLEISIQNISLVLSCEPHPKCKLKETTNCIKKIFSFSLRSAQCSCNARTKNLKDLLTSLLTTCRDRCALLRATCNCWKCAT